MDKSSIILFLFILVTCFYQCGCSSLSTGQTSFSDVCNTDIPCGVTTCDGTYSFCYQEVDPPVCKPCEGRCSPDRIGGVQNSHKYCKTICPLYMENVCQSGKPQPQTTVTTDPPENLCMPGWTTGYVISVVFNVVFGFIIIVLMVLVWRERTNRKDLVSPTAHAGPFVIQYSTGTSTGTGTGPGSDVTSQATSLSTMEDNGLRQPLLDTSTGPAGMPGISHDRRTSSHAADNCPTQVTGTHSRHASSNNETATNPQRSHAEHRMLGVLAATAAAGNLEETVPKCMDETLQSEIRNESLLSLNITTNTSQYHPAGNTNERGAMLPQQPSSSHTEHLQPNGVVCQPNDSHMMGAHNNDRMHVQKQVEINSFRMGVNAKMVTNACKREGTRDSGINTGTAYTLEQQRENTNGQRGSTLVLDLDENR